MSDILLYLPPGWIQGDFVKAGEIDYESTVEIYVDLMPKDPVRPGVFRFIAILEPFDSLKNSMIRYFRKYKNCYNYILTYHQDILDNFPNSMVSVTPTTWVRDYEPEKKEFNVSSVFGNKHLSLYLPGLEGYNVRWELFTRREEIKIDKMFYLSSSSPIPDINYEEHLILKDLKTPMFDSQFHIAIENTNKIKNAFSEKLIDCFHTRTIPIYYGPSNIGDFFNAKGIFIVNSVDDIINVCNGLNENTYDSLRDVIEENYNISLNYKKMEETMILNVKKVLGVK
jgi:hypothetical protein